MIYSSSGLEIHRYSSFWSGIISIRHITELGINRTIGNGQTTLFWLDRWQGECALYCTYPNLFKIVLDPLLTVSNAFHNNSLSIQFTRQLTGVLLIEWNHLSAFYSLSIPCSVNSGSDTIHWRWTATGLFTVHSLYIWLDYGGIRDKDYRTLWKTKIPLKIKIFTWLVKEGKILTKDNLAKKGWIGDHKCHFCNENETIDHLFVTCPLISSIWSWIAEHNNFNFDCVTIADLWVLDAFIPLKDSLLIELIRAATLWTIWLNRNKEIGRAHV